MSTDLFKNLAPQEPELDQEPEEEVTSPRPDELSMLKQRAKLMGMTFSGNIGLEALKAKVQAKLDGEAEAQEEALEQEEHTLPVELARSATQAPVKTARQLMYEQEMKLVRLRITNLDPKKKDLPGEIFTVANETLGAVKKYIPYGEVTDGGYHVPFIIYRQLLEREFLNIRTRKDNRGRTHVETSMSREFALEVLPPLTEKELAQLAAQQAAAAGMANI